MESMGHSIHGPFGKIFCWKTSATQPLQPSSHGATRSDAQFGIVTRTLDVQGAWGMPGAQPAKTFKTG